MMGVEEEFLLLDRNDSWPVVFQQIRTEAAANQDVSTRDSRRPEFRNRNRYRDVNPYDHSRVRIERNGIDYINASLVESPRANRAYILTQGPLPDTAGHFWLMVWEQDSKVVLMLNKIIEKDQVKCFQYYPTGEENAGKNEMIFDDVGLRVTFVGNKESNYHYTARIMKLEDMQVCCDTLQTGTHDTKEVVQFHYTAWPDFGVPESPDAFLDFLHAVRGSGGLGGDVGPPVIHCSAGIGRSGTFCLVDTCLVMMEQNAADADSVSVRDVLLDMRSYRMGLIQTADQLRFSYLAIVEGARRLHGNGPSAAAQRRGWDEEHTGNDAMSTTLAGVACNGGSNNNNMAAAPLPAPALSNNNNDDFTFPRHGGVPPLPAFLPPPPPQQPVPLHLASSSLDVPPASPRRLERNIPHACSTEEASASMWSTNNVDWGEAEPTVLPGGGAGGLGRENSCNPSPRRAAEVRRRDPAERTMKTAEQLALMKRHQADYFSLFPRPSTPRGAVARYGVAGAAVAVAIGAYFLYRVFGS